MLIKNLITMNLTLYQYRMTCEYSHFAKAHLKFMYSVQVPCLYWNIQKQLIHPSIILFRHSIDQFDFNRHICDFKLFLSTYIYHVFFYFGILKIHLPFCWVPIDTNDWTLFLYQIKHIISKDLLKHFSY